MVYYRKYRPQTIFDLDSGKLRETLFAVLSGNNIPHAFLFTGPKGLGKTSTARIVAKVVNCERNSKVKNQKSKAQVKSQKLEDDVTNDQRLTTKDQLEPCNQCEQCTSITKGTHIDVLEIDGASNRGIDEIRELRERVHLAPSSAKKKIYIIDEVHMLTTEAFNALLKTIEEPPSHVMFLFCTTESHKVPATIVSRCFHINFQLATEDEIVHSLKRIVQGEQVSIADEVLQFIAQRAEGGFRDAAKSLEEMVALAGGKEITKEFIEEKFHVSSSKYYVSSMLDLLAAKKTKESLELVQEIITKGIHIKHFMSQVIEALHTILLAKAGVLENHESKKNPPHIPSAGGDERGGSSIEEISVLVSLLSEAYNQLKFAVIPQLPLEMAIIAYTSSTFGKLSVNFASAESGSVSLNNKHTMDTLLKKQQAMKVKDMLAGKKEEKPKAISSSNITQNNMHSQPDERTALYENIVYKVKPYNHSLTGILRGCIIKEITDTQLVFEAGYAFHKERLEEKKSCEIIERVIKEITGKSLKVSVVLKK